MEFIEIDVLALVVTAIEARRFRKSLLRWAAKNGFEYSAAERVPTAGITAWKHTRDGRYDDVWFRQYAGFFPFDTGGRQRVQELLVKVVDGAVWRVFRFDVANSGWVGMDASSWVCTVELEMDLKGLQVRPVEFSDKLVGLFGRRDIQTGSGEFDDKFHVSGESEPFARDFLDSGMKRFLMEFGTFRWQVRGPHAMLVWPHSFDVKDVDMMLFAMRRFVGQIPEPVMRQYPGP